MARLLAAVLATAAIVLLIVHLTGGADGSAGDEGDVQRPIPRPGELAPRFELPDQFGKPVAIGGPSASWTIVSFFRSASSPW